LVKHDVQPPIKKKSMNTF